MGLEFRPCVERAVEVDEIWRKEERDWDIAASKASLKDPK